MHLTFSYQEANAFWLCCRGQLDLVAAIEHAGGKAAGVFPPTSPKTPSPVPR